MEERLPETLRRLAEAHARLARVHLLFGKDTSAGISAQEVINALWNGRGALERDEPAIADALQASGRALTHLNEFTASARTALEQPWRLGEGTEGSGAGGPEGPEEA